VFNVKYVKHIHLDTSSESSFQDVSNFLRRRIADIVEINDLNWVEWPGEQRMDTLCVRALGLFIWALTVVKFFQAQIDAMGSECLDDLLEQLSTGEGMSDINTLYGTILQLVYKSRENSWEFETFRRVVGCIVILREPLCLAEIAELLDLCQAPSKPRVNIMHLICRLQTILVAGTLGINHKTVPHLHKSFFEYITSEHAEICFRVNPDISNGELAVQCLRQFAGVCDQFAAGNSAENAKPEGPIPTGLGYALQFWHLHLPQVKRSMAGSPGIAMMGHNMHQLPGIQQLLPSSPNDLIYARPLGITLSPDQTQVVTSWEKYSRYWNKADGQPIKRPINTVVKEKIFAVTFSPDGRYIASAGDHGSVHIWDLKNRHLIGAPLYGHTGKVHCIMFSPDGKQVASGGADTTMRIWDLESKQPIGQPIIGHASSVTCITSSPDGNSIVSGGEDKTLRMWNWQGGKPIGRPMNAHATCVTCVTFSPNGQQLASGSTDGAVYIWNMLPLSSQGLPSSLF
jgi:WD domain, G-beta repeat